MGDLGQEFPARAAPVINSDDPALMGVLSGSESTLHSLAGSSPSTVSHTAAAQRSAAAFIHFSPF